MNAEPQWEAHAPQGGKASRILIASHSHPKLSKGGAEIAAFELYKALLADTHYDAWFAGCQRGVGVERLGSPFTQPFSDREVIYNCGDFDWFKFSNRDPRFPSEFRKLLAIVQPEIVHFHHYINFGVEAFQIIKDVLPDTKIIVTLHEYLAICHHFGQMITKPLRQLCRESGPERCAKCFPEIGPATFFLRRLYLERFFGLVDHFISPSEFLARRYVAWGIDPARISVIENVLAGKEADVAPRLDGERHGPLRLGFFGQISALKGIKVFLEAAALLEKAEEEGIEFEIFGDHRNQPPEFQAEFLAAQEKAGNNVRFHGPYDQLEVDALMQSVDMVAVPSVWWENSPVVIQEAFRNRRPVICSDIGGMAEKVRDKLDGFHFTAGSASSLASLLRRIAADPARLEEIRQTMQVPASGDVIIERHKLLYDRLTGRGEAALAMEVAI